MNFEFSEDQQLLREQARGFLSQQCTTAQVRQVLDGDERYHLQLWQGIAELGWLGASIPEEYGGLGLGYLELCVLAEELGRAIAPVPFSSTVYLFAEIIIRAGSDEQKRRLLPRIASGDLIGTIAITESPGALTPSKVNTTVNNGMLDGVKLPVPDGNCAQAFIVLTRAEGTNDRFDFYLMEKDAKGLSIEPLSSIDPTRDFARLNMNRATSELVGSPGTAWSVLEDVYDNAAVLFSFEQLGGAQTALNSACDYARERYAFGRPIGSFQAIKHRLADLFVATELARANCYYGAWALSTNAPELSLAAPTARIGAIDAYEQCAKENIQVHGGMGFTWEFDCHLHYRRSKALALAVGAASHWKNKLIRRLEARNTAA